jgi:predicted nucleotidyltransferase
MVAEGAGPKRERHTGFEVGEMRDPDEGLAPDGTIRTGIARERVPATFEPVLAAAVDLLVAAAPAASVYLYGSVATGQALSGVSDVDLLTLGVSRQDASRMGYEVFERFRHVCRGVEVATADRSALTALDDRAYGDRAFLRHYCLHLAGPDPAAGLPAFPADVRVARGFNGDIGWHAARWRQALDEGQDAARVARSSARKTLLAVAGLVSVHDRTWTTDRRTAADRYAGIEPSLADGLGRLLRWSEDPSAVQDVDPERVREELGGTVAEVAAIFRRTVGSWVPGPEGER